MQCFAVGANPRYVGPRVALSATLELKVVANVHFDIFRRRLEYNGLAVHVQVARQADLFAARVGQIARQVADVIPIERIKVEKPVLTVQLVIGPQTLYGILELEHVVVSGQVEDFAVVLTMQTPANALAILGRQLDDGALGAHVFAGTRHDGIEYDAILVSHIKARYDLGQHVAKVEY